MPYTLNGIGTHYYGARNRSARIARCGSCGREATLSSYDTREFFVFVFIPLIPLRKYRILDDCSACRRHQRLPLASFQAQLDEAMRPLQEALRRSPNDAAVHAELIRTLNGFHMRDQAAAEAVAAAGRHPQNAELLLLAGQLTSDAGNWQEALPFYERAYGIEPQNPTAAYGYGWLLHQMQRHEQAVAPLQRAAGLEDTRIAALYVLGQTQMRLGRWHEAVQSLQQVLPHFPNDKKLIGLIADCKKQLGYELTPAERSAGRRWWPFGSRTRPNKQPRLASAPALVRPGLRWAGGIIAVFALFGGAFYAWDAKTNIPVYFDNAFKHAVDVELDGRHFTVGGNEFNRQPVKGGHHTVVVREIPGNREIERQAFDVEELGFVDALTADRFFVYNVAALRVYRRAVVVYAQDQADQSYEEEYFALQRFFEQRGVDYAFSNAPESVEASSSSSKISKTSFTPANEVNLMSYAMFRMQQGNKKEARAALDHAVSFAPCDIETRRAQIAVTQMAANADEAANVARQWIGACAPDDVEAHRMYQEMHVRRGLAARMRTEYAAKLAADPNSAKLHYLAGRIAADPAVALAEYNAAVKLDPAMAWPRAAIGSLYTTQERYADAMREYAAVLDMKGADPQLVLYYAFAAVANGTPQDAVAKVDAMRAAAKDDVNVLEARYLLALGASDWDTAVAIAKDLAKYDGPLSAFSRRASLLRMRGDDAALSALLAKAKADPSLKVEALQIEIGRAIEKGDLAAIPALIAEGRKQLDPTVAAMMQLYAAGAFTFAGDSASAAQMLAGAENSLGDQDDLGWFVRKLVAGAKGSVPMDEVFTTAREVNAFHHALFIAAMRAPSRAQAGSYLARAARANGDFRFPYFEAKGIAARFTGARPETTTSTPSHG